MGKAVAAATRVFGIIEYPSKIDAAAIDESKEHIRIVPEDVKGKLNSKTYGSDTQLENKILFSKA